MSRFGNLVGALRKREGLTLEAVGRKLGTTKSYVCGIETGKLRPPSMKKIRQYARVFGQDLRMLVRLAWVDRAPAIIHQEAEEFLRWYDSRRSTAG